MLALPGVAQATYPGTNGKLLFNAYDDDVVDPTECSTAESEVRLHDLTTHTNTTLRAGQNPDWSPDGEKIALQAGDIWTMNADGTGAVQLTNHVPAPPPLTGFDQD